ncbi:MAG: hypothetical protein AAFY70_11860 [Bacteroidota bacterium]
MSYRKPEHIYQFLRSSGLPYWILYKREPQSGSSAFQEYWRNKKVDTEAEPEVQIESSIDELSEVLKLYKGADPGKVLFKIEAAAVYNSRTVDRKGQMVFTAPEGDTPTAPNPHQSSFGGLGMTGGADLVSFLGMRETMFNDVQRTRENMTIERIQNLQDLHAEKLKVQNREQQLEMEKKLWEEQKKREKDEIKRLREEEVSGVEKWDKVLERVDKGVKTIGNYVIAYKNNDPTTLGNIEEVEEELTAEEEVVTEIEEILLDRYSLEELKELLTQLENGEIKLTQTKEAEAAAN